MHRLRAVPIAVLVALATVLTGLRLRRTSSAPPVTARPGGNSDGGAAPASDLAAAPLKALDAGVPDHAARMLHGDRHHTHRAHGHGPREAHLTWKYTTGGPIEAQVVTSPDEKTLYVASLDGTLTALGRDGQKRWSVSLGDRIYGTPAVADDGTLYVGSDSKFFSAVSPSGVVLWKLETGADADTSAAFAKDGKIIFSSGRKLYAVRPGGDVAWRFQAKGKIFSAPAIADDGTILFGAQDHGAYAVSPAGALVWWTDLGADVDCAPAIGDDGAFFFGSDAPQGEVVRLDSKGDIVWRAAVGGFVRGALSVGRDGDLLAGVYGPTPRTVRISATDGLIRGSFSIQGTGAKEFGVHGGALEDDDGTLFFGAQDDAAYAVDRTGKTRWRFATQGDVDAPFTLLGDGSLVVPSDDGNVYLLSP
ncbi:MAG: PQQ-binding-like beta-propeller repeat protein [Polyangiaceae bacterium]